MKTTRPNTLGRQNGIQRKTEVTCDYCGSNFEKWPCFVHERNYCSRSCAAKDRTGIRATHRIPHSAESRAKMSEAKRGKTPNRVYAKGPRLPRPHFTCVQCGIEFETTRWQGKRKPKFCSNTCHFAYQRAMNPAKYIWKDRSLAALKRDHGRCCDCSVEVTGRQCHVHHLVPRSMFGTDYNRMHDLSNLITLCASCHRKHHVPWNRGQRASDDVRAKLSAAHLGKPWSPARRAAYNRKHRTQTKLVLNIN